MNTELSRRAFLGQTSIGFGAAALSTMLPATTHAHALAGLPHFAATAKRVIFLYMSGGPSHLELFDYKPELARRHLQPMPASFTRGQPIAQLQTASELKCFAPQFRFRRAGQSGQEISELLPNISRI